MVLGLKRARVLSLAAQSSAPWVSESRPARESLRRQWRRCSAQQGPERCGTWLSDNTSLAQSPVERAQDSRAEELCTLRLERVTLFPASALLARPGACPESWLSSSQQPSKQSPPSPSIRMGLKPSGLLSAPEVYPLLWGPSWEQLGGGPAVRDLSATAATVLLGSPRSLLSRYRHTWDAKDSKLGGDVNGPGQTNAGIRSRVQSRGAGAGLERQKGWDRDKKKKKR
uniref:Uncharacterized protein n=1 Tax=Mus musculus TaxID=10090 RepID=Q8C7X4_MOUSE|nr:unnamed protein product [Mus musculus]